MKVTKDKNCYCFTCKKLFHYLGIAGHRMAHKRRKENCEISFTNDDTYFYNYADKEDKQ